LGEVDVEFDSTWIVAERFVGIAKKIPSSQRIERINKCIALMTGAGMFNLRYRLETSASGVSTHADSSKYQYRFSENTNTNQVCEEGACGDGGVLLRTLTQYTQAALQHTCMHADHKLASRHGKVGRARFLSLAKTCTTITMVFESCIQVHMVDDELTANRHESCLNCLPVSGNHSMTQYEYDKRQLVQYRQTSKRHYAAIMSLIRSASIHAVTLPRQVLTLG
jgi:hypothetical protein